MHDRSLRRLRQRTLLHPATSICVSSIVHFFRGFFSGFSLFIVDGGWWPHEPWPMFMFMSPASAASSPPAILRILPFFASAASSGACAESGECTPRPVSSRKLHAGKMRGEESEGRARETRRCFAEAEAEEAAAAERAGDEEEGGKGAVKEKVDAAYGCADVEGMFAVVVVVIAGGWVSVSAREPKVRDLGRQKAAESRRVIFKSEPGRAEQRRKSESESDV